MEPGETMRELGFKRASFYRFLEEHSETKSVKGIEIQVCPPLGGQKYPQSSWRFRRSYVQAHIDAIVPVESTGKIAMDSGEDEG